MTLHSNTNTLKKIFPEPPNGIYSGLKVDDEGLYSITHPKDANLISESIIEIIGHSNIQIVDMTAGCGGNMISFIKYFKFVIGIEFDKVRYKILKENLEKYSKKNYQLLCGDATKYPLNSTQSINDDVYFIDPPWGGPEYKNNPNIQLYLSNIKLEDFIKTIPKGKLIILKLPFNYNIDTFKNIIIKTLFINNILIIFLKYI
jgi:16S rRNA G966 N2-methylase RsmD